MPEVALFIVKCSMESGPTKYWTGSMNRDWPVYVRDRRRARQMTESEALQCAARFKERAPSLDWIIEPAKPA